MSRMEFILEGKRQTKSKAKTIIEARSEFKITVRSKLTFETLTDVLRVLGAGSPMSLLSFDSKLREAANDRGVISGGAPKMSCPLSSLFLASDVCFLLLASESLCNVPLNSRCFATSGIE
ncbi:hypothetical protein SDJN02_03923, partial [Cucurbita argyrosperma subsp. argyrosperma]